MNEDDNLFINSSGLYGGVNMKEWNTPALAELDVELTANGFTAGEDERENCPDGCDPNKYTFYKKVS